MAHVIPPLSCFHPLSAGEYTERAVLESLSTGLPEAYTLFYQLRWARTHANHDRHGELDIVVVNAAGDIAILEVKAGDLSLSERGVFKRYGAETKDIVQQASTQFGAILHRLNTENFEVRLQHFLVLPDKRIGDAGTISYPRERIADALDCQDLPGYIQRHLGAGMPNPIAERVLAFFANRLSVDHDLGAVSSQLQRQVSQIAGGLAQWVPRIEAPTGVVRVVATAGSGKTQLALGLLRGARVKNLRAAYVCFNRPMAEHMREIAPRGVLVHSFHQLCWEQAGAPAGQPDFEVLTASYLESCEQAEPDLDLLVIDEMQDFQPQWAQALIARLKVGAPLYLLEDPEQSLYLDREGFEVADAVVLRSQENYRTPQTLAQTINLLRLTQEPIQACSPWRGEAPGLHAYGAKTRTLVDATALAINACLEKSYALNDIMLLTWRGLQKTRLMDEPRLGDWRLQRFDGRYDNQGRPIYTEGELRFETLRRFKGQSAPAVVLTEIDFETLSPLDARMLFVGMTRATMHLEMVMSESAERAIMARLTLGGSHGEPLRG